MSPAQLRKRLGMTRAEVARAFGVTERTAIRWDEGTEPQGVAAEVFRGIEQAMTAGVDPFYIATLLRFGIGTLLRLGFENGGFVASIPTKRTSP